MILNYNARREAECIEIQDHKNEWFIRLKPRSMTYHPLITKECGFLYGLIYVICNYIASFINRWILFYKLPTS